MKFFKNKNKENEKDINIDQDIEQVAEEEITSGTKIKIISAFLIVILATLVANWVQEPTTTKVDLLGDINTPPSQDSSLQESTNNDTTETDTTLEETTTKVANEDSSTKITVTIKDFAYNPANININAGTTVEWTNMDDVVNTVTGDDFNSGTLHKGESYSHTFNKEGTYSYYSAFHPQMTGEVTVTGNLESTSQETTNEENNALEEPQQTTQQDETETPQTTEQKDDSTIRPSAMEGVQQGTTQSTQQESTTEKSTTNSVTINAQDLLKNPPKENKLASSGPEDYLYLGIIVFALWINRKKLIKE